MKIKERSKKKSEETLKSVFIVGNQEDVDCFVENGGIFEWVSMHSCSESAGDGAIVVRMSRAIYHRTGCVTIFEFLAPTTSYFSIPAERATMIENTSFWW